MNKLQSNDHENLPTLKLVAVDGPAGSGKSSVCAMVCKKLGWTYLNTGFLYRAVAVVAKRNGYQLNDGQALSKIADGFATSLRWDPESMQVWLDDENISAALYADQIGQDASEVAKNAELRKSLLPIQRRFAFEAKNGALIDGRDIGTVVFPDAPLKIFLTASIEERAKRRWQQLNGDANDPSQSEYMEGLEELQKSIAKRDKQDAERSNAPLKKADDAVLFDTSGLSPDQVTNRIIDLMKEKDLV